MRVRIHFMLTAAALLLASTGSAQFTQEWARIYPSPPNQFAEAVDIQMDAGGNIYTLGNVGNDMLLIKTVRPVIQSGHDASPTAAVL
jgi:hypothetical protein